MPLCCQNHLKFRKSKINRHNIASLLSRAAKFVCISLGPFTQAIFNAMQLFLASELAIKVARVNWILLPRFLNMFETCAITGRQIRPSLLHLRFSCDFHCELERDRSCIGKHDKNRMKTRLCKAGLRANCLHVCASLPCT